MVHEAMKIRRYKTSDESALRAMYVAQGFEYEFPDLSGPLMESVLVVTDDDGKILAAVAAERFVQLYFLCGEMDHPATKLAIIRSLHQHLADALRPKGYHSAEACLPPEIEKSFGRRLEKTFGWMKNPWNTWVKGF